jgi:hypothetical protein
MMDCGKKRSELDKIKNMYKDNNRESMAKEFIRLLGERASMVSDDINKQKEYIMGYLEGVLVRNGDIRVMVELCESIKKELSKSKPFDVWIRKTSKQDWMHYGKSNTLDEALNMLKDVSTKKPKYVDNLFGRIVQGEYVVVQENL